MKSKYFLALALAAICVPGFSQDVTRSRNMSTDQPVNGYFLTTDGRWNKWSPSSIALPAGTVLEAVDYSAATNGNAANIASGNLALARVTNAMATAGSTIGGNIPKAAITNAIATTVIPKVGITNALASAGSAIGGDIPIAAITNALGIPLVFIVTNRSTLMTNISYYSPAGVMTNNVVTE